MVGKVILGKISVGDKRKIIRGENAEVIGFILEIKQQKVKTKSVNEESEFRTKIKSDVAIIPGDIIKSYIISIK